MATAIHAPIAMPPFHNTHHVLFANIVYILNSWSPGPILSFIPLRLNIAHYEPSLKKVKFAGLNIEGY
jgi:hypothetical protein